jgi:hypothetical protein
MKMQYILNEQDIRDALAAYVMQKHNGKITGADVTLKTSPNYDRFDRVIGQTVTAVVEGDDV